MIFMKKIIHFGHIKKRVTIRRTDGPSDGLTDHPTGNHNLTRLKTETQALMSVKIAGSSPACGRKELRKCIKRLSPSVEPKWIRFDVR